MCPANVFRFHSSAIRGEGRWGMPVFATHKPALSPGAPPDLRNAQRQGLFLALAQPVCAMMPFAELQSPFIAEGLLGYRHLPPCMEMNALCGPATG